MSENNSNDGDFLDAALGDISEGALEQHPEPKSELQPAEPPAAEPPAAEPPAAEPAEPPKSVPLPTFLEMRDKAKASEAKIAELEAKINQAKVAESDPLRDSETATNVQDDLAKKVEFLESQVQQQRLAVVDSSLTMVQKQLGDEAFNEAYTAAKANPQAAHYILTHVNPGEAFLEFHQSLQRQKILERIPADKAFDDWIREEAAKLAPQQTEAPHKAPLPSLAGAKGGGAPAGMPPLSDDPVEDLLA